MATQDNCRNTLYPKHLDESTLSGHGSCSKKHMSKGQYRPRSIQKEGEHDGSVNSSPRDTRGNHPRPLSDLDSSCTDRTWIGTHSPSGRGINHSDAYAAREKDEGLSGHALVLLSADRAPELLGQTPPEVLNGDQARPPRGNRGCDLQPVRSTGRTRSFCSSSSLSGGWEHSPVRSGAEDTSRKVAGDRLS